MRLDLDDLKGDAGVLSAEVLRGGDDDTAHGAGERSDTYGPSGLGVQACDLGLDGVDVFEDLARASGEDDAEWGESDPPADTFEQRGLSLPFQLGELSGHAGWAHPAHLRDRADGPAQLQLMEQTQPPRVEHRYHSCSSMPNSLG